MINTIVKKIGKGKPIFSKLNLRADEMKKLYPNISKARRILNWLTIKGKKFPDLTGDGKVTFADILKGRGVKRRK